MSILGRDPIWKPFPEYIPDYISLSKNCPFRLIDVHCDKLGHLTAVRSEKGKFYSTPSIFS